MFCPQCGSAAANQDHFCRYCGTQLGERSTEAEPHEAPVAAGTPEPAYMLDAAREAPANPPAPAYDWDASPRVAVAAPRPRPGEIARPAGKILTTEAGDYELASFGRRLGGYLLDMVVTWFTWTIVGIATVAAGTGPGLDAVLVLGWGGLWWTFNAVGWTPGKRMVGIRIVRLHGGPPGVWPGLGRLLAGILSAIPLGLGYLWAAWDGANQTWHDKMAGTYVVRVR